MDSSAREEEQDQKSSPIFVLGAARSGSSIVAYGLAHGVGIPRFFNECHVFPLLEELLGRVKDYYASFDGDYLANKKAHMIATLSQERLEEALINLFKNFYQDTFQSAVWVDKTPSSKMVRGIPLLARVYPNARFVFTKRRGIENVLSRQRKFPQSPFDLHCLEWASCMSLWRQMRPHVQGKSIEIDQRDVALQPGMTAQRIGEFLNLNEAQLRRLSHVWTHARPEQSAVARDYKSIGLDEAGWTPAEKETFIEVCGPMMSEYGYSLQGEVFDVPEDRLSIRLFFPVGEGPVVRENIAEKYLAPVPSGFLLHPNAPGEKPATVTYLDVDFAGHNSFQSLVKVNHERSEAIRFSVAVYEKETNRKVIEQTQDVSPLESQQWSFNFPPLRGAHNVTVSTAMVPGAVSNGHAWAIWECPHFRIE